MIKTTSILRSKFLHVLLSLILYFVATPFLTANYISNALLSMMFFLLVLVSINVTTEKVYLLVCSIFFGMLSLGTYLQMLFGNAPENIYLFHYVVNMIFLMIISYSVILSVAVQDKVTPDTIFGAISAYLLIGLTWSYIYLTLQTSDSNAFNDHGITSEQDRLQHFIYYSFVTLTTVGYGDIVANTNISRMFSWLEAVTGQIYLAVWISQLVGLRILQKEECRS